MIKPGIEPMLSKTATGVPEGPDWVYEPKWDGFRALIFKQGSEVAIVSRKQTRLNRYFPELIATLESGLPDSIVIDGEIIFVGERGLEFETLQLRLHPAASRVNRLAGEIPVSFVAFDILSRGENDLVELPLSERRTILLDGIRQEQRLYVTPQTTDAGEARSWFTRFEGAGLDGVIAKLAGQAYMPGKREWFKIKHQRTADCVAGGYRMAANGSGLGSLLLGLYDEHGVLSHVGHTSSFSAKEKRELLEFLAPYVGEGSFGEGRTPGGQSRWSGGRDMSWVELRPELVCEVGFEKLEGHRFRHAARFLRWREDKSPGDCRYDQLEPPEQFDFADIVGNGS